MALEQLAGPFEVIDRARGVAVGASVSGTPIWWDSAGLLLPVSNEGVYLVQFDGAAYRIADDRSLDYGLALLGQAPDPSARSRAYAVSRSLVTGAGEWDLDPVTRHRYGRNSHSSVVDANNYARLHDRYLRPIGGRIEARPLDLSSDYAHETSFADLSNASFLSWGQNTTEVVIAGSSGQFVRYDWARQRQVGAVGTIGMNCSGLWFSARHGIFISLHNLSPAWSPGLALRVWAPSVQPASLSTPVLSTAAVAGRRVGVSTRVLGAHGEPCPEEVVTWRQTGPGQLVLGATSTDAAGWARTWVDLPLQASGDVQISGTLQIHAELGF